jgi:hypothetical protein
MANTRVPGSNVSRLRRWLIRILVVLAVLVAVGAVGFLSVRDAGHVEPIEYYRLVEPDTIAIGTHTGEAVWTRVADVTETESGVLVVVKTWMIPFIMRPGIGYPIELTVILDGPLGDRVVIDGRLREVPRMSCDDLKDPWRRLAGC